MEADKQQPTEALELQEQQASSTDQPKLENQPAEGSEQAENQASTDTGNSGKPTVQSEVEEEKQSAEDTKSKECRDSTVFSNPANVDSASPIPSDQPKLEMEEDKKHPPNGLDLNEQQEATVIGNPAFTVEPSTVDEPNGAIVSNGTHSPDNNGSANADIKDKPNTDETDQGMLTTPYYFGVGSCHPASAQVLASAKFFTFMLCLFGLVEGALISGFEPVIVSGLERRYRFSSTAASVIIIMFDIAVTVSVIFVSYFGEKAHKPRWIGIAFFAQGVGAFVFALPHFVFGAYDAGSAGNDTIAFEACNDPADYTENCDAANSGAYILFLIGNAIIGIAAGPLFTVGVSYIDDIVMPKWVSLHIGAFQVATIAGPAIGFGLGSAFLRLYVDVPLPTVLTESDPGWVGAWWLSFIIVAIVSMLGSIPFFFFPRLLSNSKEVMEARQKQMKGSYKAKFGDEKTFLQQVKAFPFHLFGVFKSKSWLFLTIGIAVLFLSLDGLVSFAAKYIESVYRVPPSTAGLLIGAMGIVAGAIGTLTGAGIAHCVKIGKNMGIVNWVTVLIAVFPLVGFFFVCPNVDVVGIGTAYTNNTLMPSSEDLLASCNAECDCSSTIFEPVCGADGLNYFSPCRASCDKFGEDKNPMFEKCHCIASRIYSNMVDSGLDPDYESILANSTATRGLCPDSCPFLPIFIVMVTIFVFLIFLIRVPFQLVTIRAVADEQRSFALGIQSVMFRVFGSIPGPLLFGVIIDSGCVYGQFECGRMANCWVYDNHLLSTRAYIFCTIGVAACVVCAFLSWVFYPPVGFKRVPPDETGECKKEGNDKEEEAGPVGSQNPSFVKTEAELY